MTDRLFDLVRDRSERVDEELWLRRSVLEGLGDSPRRRERLCIGACRGSGELALRPRGRERLLSAKGGSIRGDEVDEVTSSFWSFLRFEGGSGSGARKSSRGSMRGMMGSNDARPMRDQLQMGLVQMASVRVLVTSTSRATYKDRANVHKVGEWRLVSPAEPHTQVHLNLPLHMYLRRLPSASPHGVMHACSDGWRGFLSKVRGKAVVDGLEVEIGVSLGLTYDRPRVTFYKPVHMRIKNGHVLFVTTSS